MKRSLAPVTLLGLIFLSALAGCGGVSSKTTSLKLVADNGGGGKAVFHLRCDPAGGDIKHPAAACEALKTRPAVLFHPKPFICLGGSWNISISGRFQGKPVDVKTVSCWTPQMELIDRLGIADQLESHIVPWPVRHDLFAKVAEIRPGTPRWLIAEAEVQARSLGDARPERIRLGSGMTMMVELWGSFRCEKGRITNHHGGNLHQVRHGVYARILFDAKTRRVLSLWIGPALL